MTIQLTIRLFGTLGLKKTDYDHKKGIMVDVPDNITPEQLLEDMHIPVSHIGLISDGNQSIQLDTLLSDKMTINFFSLVCGG